VTLTIENLTHETLRRIWSRPRRFISVAASVIEKSLPRNDFGDRLFWMIDFFRRHRRIPRRDSGLFNDRLYFMKYDGELKDPLRQFVTDKEFLKVFTAYMVGAQYNVPTLAILRDPDTAAAHAYPARCVIKPTHASGEVIIRQAGEPIDTQRIAQWFILNFYNAAREPNYRYLKPKIIVEPIVFENPGLEDFKIFCVKGIAKLVQVDFDRHSTHTRSFYSRHWVKQPFGLSYPIGPEMPKPHNFAEMIEIAEKLSSDFSFMRVDLYSDGHRAYAGELNQLSRKRRGRFCAAWSREHRKCTAVWSRIDSARSSWMILLDGFG
jgi:hypothetical protein